MRFDEPDAITAEAEEGSQDLLLGALTRELTLLRKTVLRQGHAQELFQARVEEAVARMAEAGARPAAPASPALPTPLSTAQVRTLVELDQAVLQLLRLAETDPPSTTEEPEEPEDTAPCSLREGLSLLQVRVRNLQHSMGLEALPTHQQFFDDRRHEACGVAHRPDLPDGWVVEEVLPGYRLGGRVVRPARVVVNRREEDHG